MLGETSRRDPPKKPVTLFTTPDSSPPTCYCVRRLSIPDDEAWKALVNGAVSALLNPLFWQQSDTGISVDEVIAAFAEMWLDYLGELEIMIGAIIPMITDVLPNYMLWADGSTYQRADFPDLYGRLPATFIIDANSFFVPDLRGRTVIGSGQGTGLTDRPLGMSGGEETHQLTVDEMPAHNHDDAGHTHGEGVAASTIINGGLEAPANSAIPTAGTTGVGYASIQPAGGDAAHNNMQPYLALRFAIVAKSRDAC